MTGNGLVRCVGDPERFLADAWTRRPHLKGGDAGEDFGDLLSRDHVDHILTTMSLRYPAFRLVERGRVLTRAGYTRTGTVGGQRVDDLIDVGRVMERFAAGATIVLQGVHRYWPPVTGLCRELEVALTHPVQANAYITPPVASGLRVHHDTHDVFALQTDGEKHWLCYEPVVEQPLAGHRWSSEHDPGDPVLDAVLRPGDCLYVPRGTPHAARTVDAPSIHLTVGVRQITWHDVLRSAFERASEEVGFRGTLPAGFAHDPAGLAPAVATRLKEAAAWLETLPPGELAEAAADRFWSSRVPQLRGQLGEILDLDSIDDDTRVSARPHGPARLRRDDDRLRLDLGDREVAMPARLEPVMRRLVRADGLRVGDLGDLLDEGSRLVVVRRLVREGLLTTVRD